ncbi:hypothetical protein ABPG74_004633 [Tetrahymena malaccensis]
MTALQINSEISSFAFSLFKEFPTNTNLIFSPASIYLVLAMTSIGSNTETLQEFKNVLGFENPKQFAQQVRDATQILLDQSQGVQTKIANKIYYGFTNLDEEYQKIMQESFSSSIEQVDFQKDYELSRVKINKWVESVTNDRVKDLIQPDSLSPSTLMVLVNAIYFNGKFDKQFPKYDTQKREFNVSDNSKVLVDLMLVENEYPFFENESYQYVQIPYKGKQFMMEIILPKEDYTLSEVEENLTLQNLLNLRQNANEIKIDLGLPKFKIEYQTSKILKGILNKLGLKKCFQADADFSSMSKNNSIFIDDIVQKSVIEVNEEGAEAAAATYAQIVFSSARISECKKPKVLCTRPFLYTISHKPSGQILFIGRMKNPIQNQ